MSEPLNGIGLVQSYKAAHPELYGRTYQELVAEDAFNPAQLDLYQVSMASSSEVATSVGLGQVILAGLGVGAAVGGGGGGGGGGIIKIATAITDATSPASLISGAVVDDPVVGATVFWDVNNNQALDAGEIFTTTDENGQYQIAEAPTETAVLVALGGQVDTDGDGQGDLAFAGVYQLSQEIIERAGEAQINPITHIVSTAGEDLDQALEMIAGRYEIELDDLNDLLTTQPGGTDGDAALSAKLLSISQELGNNGQVENPTLSNAAPDLGAASLEKTVISGNTVSGTIPGAADVDGDGLKLVLTESLEHGSVVIDGLSYVYTPNAGFTGTETLTFKVTDGLAVSDNSVLIEVDVFKAPQILNLEAEQSSENQLDLVIELSPSVVGETQFVLVTVPENTYLNKGLAAAPGIYLLNSSDLSGLKLNVSDDADVSLSIGVEAYAAHGGVKSESITGQPLSVTMTPPVADTPELSLSNPDASGEGSPVDLSEAINAQLTDLDNSEQLTIEISGVPVGAYLTNGVRTSAVNEVGTYRVTSDDLEGLSFVPSEGQDGTFSLTVTATAVELSTNDTAEVSGTLTIVVDPVASAVSATFDDLVVDPGDTTSLELTSLANVGADDVVSVYLTGYPDGVSFSAGTLDAELGWQLTLDQLQTVTMSIPENIAASFTLSAQFIAEDGTAAAVTNTDIGVQVILPPQEPTVAVVPDEQDATVFTVTVTESGNTTQLYTYITGLPSDARVLYQNGDGEFVEAGSFDPNNVLYIFEGLQETSEDSGEWTQQYKIKTTAGGTLENLSFVAVARNEDSPESASGNVASTVEASVLSDPLVVDLDGDGFELTDVNTNSIQFDFDGEGTATKTGWVGADDGLLVKDLSGNGVIDNGREVFSDWFSGGANGDDSVPFTSASAALASLDENSDNVISGSELEGISVWQDLNQDGVSDAGELLTLADLNVQSIDLAMNAAGQEIGGNVVLRTGSLSLDGGTLNIADVALRHYLADPNVNAPEIALDSQTILGVEDTAVDLGLNVTASGLSFVTVSGVENGKLNVGFIETLNGESVYFIPASNGLSDLQFIPNENFSGNLDLEIMAFSSNLTTGELAVSAIIPVSLNIAPVADQPDLFVTNQILVDEDTQIDLAIDVSAVAPTAEETLSLSISGVPAGAVLKLDGVEQVLTDGAVTFSDPDHIAAINDGSLSLSTVEHYSGNFSLEVSAVSAVADTQAEASETINVVVKAVADTPVIDLDAISLPATLLAGETYDLPINASTPDSNESLIIEVTGLPQGIELSAGYTDGLSWYVSSAEATTLQFTVNQSAQAGSITVNAYSFDGYTSVASASANIDLPETIQLEAQTPTVPGFSALKLVAGQETSLDLSGIVLNNDDGGSETLTVLLSGLPEGATLSAGQSVGAGTYLLNADQLGVLTLTLPDELIAQDYSLSFKAFATENNGDVATAEQMTVLTVLPTPVLKLKPVTGTEDEPVELTVTLQYHSDMEVETLQLSGLADGVQLKAGETTLTAESGVYTLTPEQLATLVVVPPTDSADDFSFTVEAEISLDGETVAQLSRTSGIYVVAVNDAPQVNNETALTNEDTEISLSDLLANDFDVENDALWLKSASAQHGEVVLSDDGQTLIYRPDSNYHGEDSITYVVTDGRANTSGQVQMTVTSVNDVPVAQPDQFTVAEDGQLDFEALQLLGNDQDIENDILEISSFTQPSNGTLTRYDNGSFSYVPVANFNGIDSFTYVVSDGEDEGAPVTVTINVTPVNDASVVSGELSGVVAEGNIDDAPVSAKGTLSISDVDQQDNPVFPNTQLTGTYGVLTLADGLWEYVLDQDLVQHLDAGDEVTDALMLTASDGTPATITIAITGSDDDPKLLGEFSADVAEGDLSDQPLTATGTLDIQDVDGDDTPAFSDVALEGNYGVFELTGIDWTYTLNQSNVQGLDAGDQVQDIFTLTASDGTAQQVTLNITGTDDLAVISGDITGAVTEGDLDSEDGYASGSLMIIDVDGDDTPMMAIEAGAEIAGIYGSLMVNNLGDWLYALDQEAVQDLDAGDQVDDVITVVATDGTEQQITIQISGTDDASVVTGSLTGGVTEGDEGDAPVTASGSIAISDVDADDTPVFEDTEVVGTYGNLVLEAGTWIYTLDQSAVQFLHQDQTADDTVTLTATDGTEQVIRISVTGTGDNPVALDDEVATSEGREVTILPSELVANDSDAEGAVTFNGIATEPVNGILESTEAGLVYTPTGDFNGTDSFTYTVVDDRGNEATATVTITVHEQNDAPVTQDDALTTNEDEALTFTAANLLDNDSDVDLDTLTIKSVTQPANGTLVLNIDGTYTYTPAENFNGADSFTYVAFDGKDGETEGTVNITVTAVDDAPVVTGDFSGVLVEGNEGEPAVTATGVLGISDVDEGNNPTFEDQSVTGSYGSLELVSGAWTYSLDQSAVQSLNQGQVVSDQLLIVASDGTEQQITLSITGTDDASVIDAQSVGFVTEDDSVTATGGLSISDPDEADNPTFTDSTQAGIYGTLAIAGGVWTYTLDQASAQELNSQSEVVETFTVTATDGNSFDITIDVAGVDDAPEMAGAAPDDIVLQQAEALDFMLPEDLFADVDSDFDLSAEVVVDGLAIALPQWLTFDALTGAFSVAEGAAEVGDYIVRVSATDVLDGDLAPAVVEFNLQVPASELPMGVAIAQGSNASLIGDEGDNTVYVASAGNSISGGSGDDLVVLTASDSSVLDPDDVIHGGSGADVLAVAGVGSNALNIDAVILDFNKTEGDSIDLSQLRTADGSLLSMGDLNIASVTEGFMIDLSGLTTEAGAQVTGQIVASAVDSASFDWTDVINLDEGNSSVDDNVLNYLDDLNNSGVVE
ncbi:VCBS domain-containing protein [Pontibacterium granulatum]|uniref:VCBS domain-containing protein n=1 Tax=Pontibacterium granulatum TaxID=2036029 RepID=UPI00249A5C67|nr:VCBS domain-containing protein [Pontibacterium granulatum]MDI3325053.1 VCBS domain-containing protein [Pontibacterium granulatum]